jgi:hypothetical protein
VLEPTVREAFCLRALVPGLDEISRDVDPEDVGAPPRSWQRRRSVAAPEIQNFEARSYAKALDDGLSRMLAAMRVKSPFSHNA